MTPELLDLFVSPHRTQFVWKQQLLCPGNIVWNKGLVEKKAGLHPECHGGSLKEKVSIGTTRWAKAMCEWLSLGVSWGNQSLPWTVVHEPAGLDIKKHCSQYHGQQTLNTGVSLCKEHIWQKYDNIFSHCPLYCIVAESVLPCRVKNSHRRVHNTWTPPCWGGCSSIVLQSYSRFSVWLFPAGLHAWANMLCLIRPRDP